MVDFARLCLLVCCDLSRVATDATCVAASGELAGRDVLGSEQFVGTHTHA